mgnify:FL=1
MSYRTSQSKVLLLHFIRLFLGSWLFWVLKLGVRITSLVCYLKYFEKCFRGKVWLEMVCPNPTVFENLFCFESKSWKIFCLADTSSMDKELHACFSRIVHVIALSFLAVWIMIDGVVDSLVQSCIVGIENI